MKNIFKSKKGAAIETSLLFLLVVFLLCALVTTYTASVRKKANGFKNEVTEKYTVTDDENEGSVSGGQNQ